MSIDNFETQPYPLECSVEGQEWMLVVAWQRLGDSRLAPIVANPTGGLAVNNDPGALRYRPAEQRPTRGPAPAVAPESAGPARVKRPERA